MKKPSLYPPKEKTKILTHEQGRKSWQRGLLAEWIAILYLRFKGWKIVAHRHKYPVGEVDIVAVKATTVIAVEVKFRRRFSFQKEFVTPFQWRRIEKASRFIMKRFPAHFTLRFDMILITPWRWPCHRENEWWEAS